VNHPKVEKRVAEIAALARAADKCAGMFCDTPASVAKWRAAGITYAALSIDATIFLSACRELARQVKEGT
jgi:2-keto-3-deoxy-L-rhamnonate aldolase RhmA